MHDLVIRGGTIVDGTGAPRYDGDVAVDGGLITTAGKGVGAGKREIDARGLLITPGFVDIHTHYDGQATWDSLLAPSSWHGVTSVVMGNCGVGFAPVRTGDEDHEFLISLMEGVEDIPGTALHEGLDWRWESFPQYLDALERRPHTIDLGTQMPHAALRAYVMGERGANHEEDATAGEIAEMARLTVEGVEAGALGFATSRQLAHRTRDGAYIGTLTAKEEELLGIAEALRKLGKGLLQFNSNLRSEAEYELLARVARAAGRPFSVLLFQEKMEPEKWRETLAWIDGLVAEGLDVKGQVCARAVGLIGGLDGSTNPFIHTETYHSIEPLPLPERVARMREPAIRERILAEFSGRGRRPPTGARLRDMASLYPFAGVPNYEPGPEESVDGIARRQGRNPVEVCYDMLLEDEGRTLLYFPGTNYAGGDLDAVGAMVRSENTVMGLSDGGAHVGFICDASMPTTFLAHWGRDRTRGERLPIEYIVKRQSHDTARFAGWRDRGVVAAGYKADLNVIDYTQLNALRPFVARDLPAGGRRLLQKAQGYRYTICAGAVTFEDGEHTGALPGRLVRGAQPAPA